jgi:3-deoxy-D-manno-octulosonic-acid transferase
VTPPAAPSPESRRSFLLGLYLAVSRRAGSTARSRLRRRAEAGKEEAERLGERMGQPGLPRPDGRLVWFHAASVGEAASLLELLKRLRDQRPELTCLVTSGTLTSAGMLASRLPDGCLHQFVPLDVLPWMRRFLDHWRPDLAIWTESELWPATLYETRRRGIPMMLINARISHQTFGRWLRVKGMARAVIGRFDRILAQDELAGEQLLALGADPGRLSVTGSLKEGASPLPCDEKERARISQALTGRWVWLAASTHEGEEEIVAEVFRDALRALPRQALILAPRHPDRGDRIVRTLRDRGLSVAQRSRGEAIADDTEIYVADTLGEMGIWYRVAPVSFVGGSLVEVGGHNPFEPALLGSAILHGPHVRNFADAYARFTDAGAAILVRNASEMARALVGLTPDRAAEMAAAGWAACSEGAEVTDLVLDEIGAILDRTG